MPTYRTEVWKSTPGSAEAGEPQEAGAEPYLCTEALGMNETHSIGGDQDPSIQSPRDGGRR